VHCIASIKEKQSESFEIKYIKISKDMEIWCGLCTARRPGMKSWRPWSRSAMQQMQLPRQSCPALVLVCSWCVHGVFMACSFVKALHRVLGSNSNPRPSNSHQFPQEKHQEHRVWGKQTMTSICCILLRDRQGDSEMEASCVGTWRNLQGSWGCFEHPRARWDVIFCTGQTDPCHEWRWNATHFWVRKHSS
jgi:hypothetical protein